MKYFNAAVMHYGAKPELFEFAKTMRHAPTKAEKLMWRSLRTNDLALYKFRRQHPIGKSIADFYSHPLLLVIEIDGGYHLTSEQKEIDTIRDEDMLQLGLTILRFTNDEVMNDTHITLTKLKEAITTLKRSKP